MKIKITRTPDAVWFGYIKMPWGVADLGRHILWICGWQISIHLKNKPRLK